MARNTTQNKVIKTAKAITAVTGMMIKFLREDRMMRSSLRIKKGEISQ